VPKREDAVAYGREVCGDLATASAHEWLAGNGIGGYASGTIDGSQTRRYHALLVAALEPPTHRMVFVSHLDERVEYRAASWALATNRWASGVVDPAGYLNIERFWLDGTTPVWNFALGDALVEKRIAMQFGANVTVVRYRVVRASAPLRFIVKALVDYRDMHATSHEGDRILRVDVQRGAVRVRPPNAGATPVWLEADRGGLQPMQTWYRDFDLPAERARGLDDRQDHLHAATFTAELTAGESWCVRVSAGNEPPFDAPGDLFAQSATRVDELLAAWQRAGSIAEAAPPAVTALVLAADQFVVTRPVAGFEAGRSIEAGYHWFGDWGRDAMIALPGLTLVTGRPRLARTILRTFDRFTDSGMLPNDFPERGALPEYNTVDAALWFVEAVRAYVEDTGDEAALDEFWPTLASTVEWYERGTRYGIRVDPADGLLRAGEAGVAVTWMDARAGERAITARIGKPVEVNALWYNALCAVAAFAELAGHDAAPYRASADRVRASFARFATPNGGLLDVVDGPGGDDPSVRPNQVFAVSLHHSPLEPERRRGVVDVCARELLTSFGLRSLSPNDPRYVGRYQGSPAERDAAYHQGTVWPWLIGPFALAHLRVNGDPVSALAYLEPLLEYVLGPGVGTLPEIADGDPPFTPRGCIAQAWSVAEVLRAWHVIRQAPAKEER
jgi:predicted glycogen debranching enzyme